ncbi:HlyD family secretion protein [Enterovirga sp. CN4-39]|uniref:HlyD family secretion protein n=1 Tax=Enterovirga sp. CN4-39 TaxID=3400910 RepID=UPI003C10206E
MTPARAAASADQGLSPVAPGPAPQQRLEGSGGSKDDKSGAPGQAAAETSTGKRARGFMRRHPIGVAIGALALLAAIVGGGLWYLEARQFETTNDAFIAARSFSVAPKVSGYIAEVYVQDNQHVAAGAPIVRIDERDFKVGVSKAEADIQSAEAAIQSAVAQIKEQESQVREAQAQVKQSDAAVSYARDENERAQDLLRRGVGTVERAQQTASTLIRAQATLAGSQAALNAAATQVAVIEAQRKRAEASLAEARAELDQAKLNLAYTNVTAQQAGRIARLTAAKGELAQAGQSLSMFVPDDMWVTANFKETQLDLIRPGQKAEMTIDAYPGRTFHGHVQSIQPGSGTAFSLLPAQNATGNYVKVVQRVPVKLVFDDLPQDVTIGPGMSVVPWVRVR